MFTSEALLEPSTFSELLLCAYGPKWLREYPQVLASQWSKYYFMCLWATTLNMPVGASVAWESARIHIGPRGLPEAFEWRDEELDVPVKDLFDAVVERHLAPWIKRFSPLTKVSAGLLWSNAGDALEQAFQQASPNSLGWAAMTRPLLANGNCNPLHDTVRYRPDGIRQVRVCCLAYRVPGIGHCAHCPLEKRAGV